MKDKSGFIWNTIGSLVYSFLNAIILVFCTRLNGIEIAGIFSICYATGCIFNAIGDMGIRIFQVTDTNRKFKFEDYLFSRIIAVLLMILISIIFVLISGYSDEKLYICLIIVSIRIIDNFGETFQAEFQLNGRLDRAGKALLYRNTVEIVIFAIADIITHNIYISFLMMLISSIIVLLLYDYRIIAKEVTKNWKFNFKNVKYIIKECIPLGISTLISMYVINAVKYGIDKHGDNAMQTYFNIIYMPTFIINLVSILIMKPLLKPFGDYWNSKKSKKFIKAIAYIALFLIAVTFIIEIASLTIGVPILSFIYGINLEAYKLELFLLVLSGFFYALSTVIFYALGTIRRQKYTTIAYSIAAFFALIISNFFVYKYKILGAAVSSVLIMFVLFVLLTIFFVHGYIKERKDE